MWTICELGQVIWFFLDKNLSIFHSGSQIGITDFVHFYIAGKITSSPLRTEAFNWDAQRQFFESITKIHLSGADFYTPYFPLVFLLMVPFVSLPLEVAHLVFDIITTGFGLLGIWYLLKQLNYLHKPMSAFVVFGILASNASWRNWTQGQIMWLFVGLTAIYLACFVSKKDLQAGVALALSIIKPQYTIYLLIPALALKRWRLLLSFLACDIVLALICARVFSWRQLIKYPDLLNQYELISSSVKTLGMNCLRAFLNLVLPQAEAFRTSVILNLVCLVIMFALCFYFLSRKQDQQTINWVMSLLILAAVLFSPHAHLHDSLLIALPALLTLPGLNTVNSVNQSFSLLSWQWILYLFPLASWFCFFLSLFGLPGNLLLTLMIAVLFVCALRQCFALNQDSIK